MKHLTTITDFTPIEITQVLDLSRELQNNPDKYAHHLATKSILFCFEKPSLRTLVGTESAIHQLGGNVIHTTPQAFLGGQIVHAGEELGQRESLKDTVNNVSQFCSAIFARVFDHGTIQTLSELSDIPVVNALCDQHHPCQALADMLTLQDVFGVEQKLHVAFVGDANNVAYSLGQVLLVLGHSFTWSGPHEYSFSDREKSILENLADEYNGQFTIENDPFAAVQNKHAIYADTFVSMGEESAFHQKNTDFKEYQINAELWKNTQQGCIFMHCLPAHRGYEVTDEIIDGPQSVVYQQAKNRMVSSKGIFSFLLQQEVSS